MATIESKLHFTQPILVKERDDMLIPCYLSDPKSFDDADLKKYGSFMEWADSLIKPFDDEPFKTADFNKIHQDRIIHAGVTIHETKLAKSLFGGFELDDIKNVYEAFKLIFYYASQSDAGGHRNRLRLDEKETVLYCPRFVETTEGDESYAHGLITLGETTVQPQIDIYTKKNAQPRNTPLNEEELFFKNMKTISKEDIAEMQKRHSDFTKFQRPKKTLS